MNEATVTRARADDVRPFGELFAEGTRNGLTRPKAVRGAGVKMVNMGELFAHPRLRNAPMARVPLSEAEADRFLLQPGDLLFARQSLVLEGAGKCSIFLSDDELVTFESHITRVRLDPRKADPRFYFYYLQSHHGRAAITSIVEQGAGASGIRGSDLEKLGVLWRPLSEQCAIAEILGAFDDKIEQNRRTARSLERLTQAIFRAWFVDFEPVKAKAAGATAIPSMPQSVFDALPARFVDSDIGPVPEGWEVGKVGDGCGINQRSVHAAEMSGAIEYVDISSVTVGRLTGLQRVPFSEAPSRARRRIAHGDTIWSCVRPNHRSHLFIHSPPENRIVSTGFAVLSPRSFGPSFLYEITTQPEFVDYLVSNADGSAYPAVRSDHFASAEIVVPPQLLRDAFEEITMPLRDSLAAGERESASLAATRDYLLPKLLSGDLRVRSVLTEKGLSSD